MNEQTGKRVEEIILITIIALQILEFMGLLPEDVGFIKKIISITAVAYLLYQINLVKIVFGKENEQYNGIVLFTFLIYQIKNIVEYLLVSGSELTKLKVVYDLMRTYPTYTQHLPEGNVIYSYLPSHSFVIASLFLIILSLYLTFKIKESRESLLEIITPKKEGFSGKLIKFFTIYFLLGAILLFIFNPLMEWVAWSVDSLILIGGLLFYFSFTNRFNEESTIYKIGSFGDNLIKRFFSLFKKKETLYLGVMGIIGLHLAVEIGNFIVPYMTLIGPTDFFENNNFYMNKLGEGHEPILNHFMQQIGGIKGFGIIGFLERTSLIWMYIGNVAIIILSLTFPLILLYILYKKKQVSVPPWILATVFASAVCYAASPLFIIRHIPTGSTLVGVDILTRSINNSTHIFLLSVIVFIAIYILSKYKKIKEYFIDVGFGIGLIFLGYYLAQFYYSWWVYTQFNITKLLLMGGAKNIFMMLILISFFIILTTVYLLGYWEFVKHSKETLKQIN